MVGFHDHETGGKPKHERNEIHGTISEELVGGFKYFLCLPLLGEMIQSD